MGNGWTFDNSYARLPAAFFTRVSPMPVRDPRMVVFNDKLARSLGLDPAALSGDPGARRLSGNEPPEGAEPIAQAYAGHQFGHFTMLGDGRAILLGEQLTPDGGRVDVQLKGSGQTPYSRRGDGRAALGPMLREYVISEAMHALGIPTTRSLAVVSTGEPVYRETVLPGAVLTRIASSHLRVGTFEYFAARGNREELKILAEYAIRRHDPELLAGSEPFRGLLDSVIRRQASLVARWMGVGFIHGVMNTDNMTISGETIDFGPCAFLDAFDPATVYSSIDRTGRYAYGAQPGIAQWNLARLAEALLPLLADDEERAIAIAQESLGRFPSLFGGEWLSILRGKLGLTAIDSSEEGAERDGRLAEEFLELLRSLRADLTRSFRGLGAAAEKRGDDPLFRSEAFAAWEGRWSRRCLLEGIGAEELRQRLQQANPAVIPRNHKVEEALAAAGNGDLSPLNQLLEAVSSPFVETVGNEPYRQPAGPEFENYRTFCGT